ncbi:caspase domain protein [Indivirus ILV1]|uniref:Caspase domain protein n=1 Tax=Indivirus ILV1 TaxID=1977633 RepID=A0A1V0SDG8_9VIRU|nr:caspase domain protein [Indivirus ILV1]
MNRNIPNLLIISACNTYKGTTDELSAVYFDIKLMRALDKVFNVRVHVFENNGREELLKNIDREVELYGDKTKNPDVDTIIFHYSGHGYRSISDNFEGINTNDDKKIALMEILGKFSKYTRLMCIFDACRVLRTSPNEPDYNNITNKSTILLHATSKGEGSHGGLTVAFYEAIKQLPMDKPIRSFGLVNLALVTIMEAIKISQKKGTKDVPKFYLSKFIRENFKEYSETIREFTNQKIESVMATRINNEKSGQYQKLIEELKNEHRHQIQSKLDRAKEIKKKVDECFGELNKLKSQEKSYQELVDLSTEKLKLINERELIKSAKEYLIKKKIELNEHQLKIHKKEKECEFMRVNALSLLNKIKELENRLGEL